MKRLAGYDLNGWRDVAVRNWLKQPGEDDETDRRVQVSGGIGSAVVALGADEKNPQPYVGGVQALLAAHGRGPAWGTLGEVWRRRSVLAALSDDSTGEQIAASLIAMAPSPDIAVLAIADTGDVNELDQERLLHALKLVGAQRRLLVWRPVLAILATPDIDQYPDRSRIGIISHTADGFSTQVLTLRQGEVTAPERRDPGQKHRSQAWGLAHLRKRAAEQLLKTLHLETTEEIAYVGLIDALALGETPRPAPIRIDVGRWRAVAPLTSLSLPLSLSLPAGRFPAALSDIFRDCEAIKLDTPLATQSAVTLAERLSEHLGLQVLALSECDVASGAFHAAERIQNDQPIYFDFLPQVSTIVEGKEGAENHNLIGADELLPAGKLYRSPTPARFAFQPNQEAIEVYLNKQDAQWPRLANIQLPEPARTATVVELTLEQQPAAGRARLMLQAQDEPLSYLVDWNSAKVIKKSWEALIESLQPQRPVVLDRLVLPSGLDLWEGYGRKNKGLSTLLQQNVKKDSPDWKALADCATQRFMGHYAVDSDGNLPRGIQKKDTQALDEMLARAEREMRLRIKSQVIPDNHPLRFATWTFKRCPESLVELLMEALGAQVGGHPLIRHISHRMLVYQGIGRVLRDKDQIKQAISHLLHLPIGRWKRDQTACMAFLLSRTDEAPRLLDKVKIVFLSKVAEKRLLEEVGGTYQVGFVNAPAFTAGLLRFRLKDPYALVLGDDPSADRLANGLDAVIKDLAEKRRHEQRLERHYQLLRDVREALEGSAKHTNLLTRIWALEDE